MLLLVINAYQSDQDEDLNESGDEPNSDSNGILGEHSIQVCIPQFCI